MTKRASAIAALVVAVCVVCLITASVLFATRSTAIGQAAPTPRASETTTSAAALPVGPIGTTPATTLLASLPVKPALSMAGYNRTSDFGRAWLDVDRNGCDTRNDILSRDLSKSTRSGVCTVLTGILVSPYTGQTISFVRGVATSSLVQIDHVVALGDAWETEAQALSQARRRQLANDPLELIAVDGHSNDQKSDKDASQWLPPNGAFDCSYVARQISVKVTYFLWVTPAEHDAMERVLAHCGQITGTTSPFAAG